MGHIFKDVFGIIIKLIIKVQNVKEWDALLRTQMVG